MKCVNIWKINITHGTNIFQMTKMCVTKSCMTRRAIKVQTRLTDFNETEQKSFEMWLQIPHSN